jgi:predicted aldo/keto reductase-like oxidoreductase
VDIPGIFSCYNDMFVSSKRYGRLRYFQTVALTAEPSFVSQCVKCGKCEQHCPQALPIRDLLPEAERALLPNSLKPAIRLVRKFMLRKGTKSK